MRFKVYDEVFEKLPDLYFGVVVGNQINNQQNIPEIYDLMKNEMSKVENNLKGVNLKEYQGVIPYRDAFNQLNLNPNKFMSSVEAMVKRVSKGNILPSINPVVDLVNRISLKYILPMGAHDLDALEGEIAIRFSRKGDTFTPLGEELAEVLDNGELVYADSKRIRTRRWIWRQSNIGKIDENSKNIFFPIDGFQTNKEKVMKASEELEILLQRYFNCQIKKVFIDINHPEMEI
ncbi:MAG TPA: phenylalanine--tRNA ligase beta subunit-related protein [Atribacterota bacterium]|nr:phenylalanine--tRNA ligase beta subunit-related protein [Atribacterota bacterium]